MVVILQYFHHLDSNCKMYSVRQGEYLFDFTKYRTVGRIVFSNNHSYTALQRHTFYINPDDPTNDKAYHDNYVYLHIVYMSQVNSLNPSLNSVDDTNKDSPELIL